MRRLGPIRAALSNIFGLGLGYVYVGRFRLAFVYVAAIIALLALAGWLRIVFQPVGLYVLGATLVGATLFVMVHSAVIAVRERTAPARWYNRWWFYLAWIIGSYAVSHGLISIRPTLLGFEPFRLPANSMAPTIQQGDFIMADTWCLERVAPKYGDLVVFRLPGDEDVKYLKRVVGLPGDQIQIIDDVLHRNGQSVDEPYVQLLAQGPASSRNFGPVVTPVDSYFVLGDSRNRSKDSRYIGPIEKRLMHGRVIHRWFAYEDGIRWDRFPEMLDGPCR